jgi:streptogramin lyase
MSAMAGLRITDYTRNRMRRRRIPEEVDLQVYDEPDGVYPSGVRHTPDREVRWRR